jgi:hypothetical protein
VTVAFLRFEQATFVTGYSLVVDGEKTVGEYYGKEQGKNSTTAPREKKLFAQVQVGPRASDSKGD